MFHFQEEGVEQKVEDRTVERPGQGGDNFTGQPVTSSHLSELGLVTLLCFRGYSCQGGLSHHCEDKT